MADRIKLFIALFLVVGAIGAFYYFGDQPLLARVVGLLVVAGMAVAVALQSSQGKAAWVFMKEARTEIRRVVWPTRKDAGQTTLLILVTVIVFGLLLWGLDSILLWAVRLLTGQGS